jgi:sugar phosphate permease
VALSSQLRLCGRIAYHRHRGEWVSNKKILAYDFAILIMALLASYFPSPALLIIASFVLGFGAVIPQLFVPMAAKCLTKKPGER